MKRHVMIDLETMGLRPTSAILSIGAVHFDHVGVIDKFYTAISLKSCQAAGLTVDQSTVNWWSKQTDDARKAWDQADAPSLYQGMKAFYQWCQRVAADKYLCPWGNGADFDLVLLKNAFDALDVEPPWRYYNHHCFRTMKNVMPVEPPAREGTHHNALDDAIYQVQYLQKILREYRVPLSE